MSLVSSELVATEADEDVAVAVVVVSVTGLTEAAAFSITAGNLDGSTEMA